MPYVALQTMLDAGFPSGLPVYWRSDFLRALSDDFDVHRHGSSAWRFGAKSHTEASTNAGARKLTPHVGKPMRVRAERVVPAQSYGSPRQLRFVTLSRGLSRLKWHASQE